MQGNWNIIGGSTYGLVLDPTTAEKPKDPPKGLIATQAVQTTAGWYGQVVVDGQIVAESDPFTEQGQQDQLDDDPPSRAAIRWANAHVVTAFRQLLAPK